MCCFFVFCWTLKLNMCMSHWKTKRENSFVIILMFVPVLSVCTVHHNFQLVFLIISCCRMFAFEQSLCPCVCPSVYLAWEPWTDMHLHLILHVSADAMPPLKVDLTHSALSCSMTSLDIFFLNPSGQSLTASLTLQSSTRTGYGSV